MSPLLWHGALMALAWLVLLPAGALVARFFKVRRRQAYPYELDDRFWWDTHRVVQSSGAALAALAAWIAWDALDGAVEWQVVHVQLGVLALSCLLLQMLTPLFRGSKGGPTDPHADPYDPDTWRGDHFDMTLRRQVFEFIHKRLGYVGLALATCAAWTGIALAGIDLWWRAGIALAVAVHAALFLRFTLAKRRVATWDAIWGPYGR